MSNKRSARKRLTRRQIRELDVEISFLEGVVQRDPAFFEALRVLGDSYLKRGRYVDGVRVDEYLAQLFPDDAQLHYNLACGYSLSRQYDHAVMALLRAIECGYANFYHLRRDPDLANLRRTRHFDRVQDQIRARTRRIEVKFA